MNQITKYLAVKISELCEKGDKLRKVENTPPPMVERPPLKKIQDH